ncbi:uncharacterized protein LOC143850681 [Tasmannia lanceolata]|uniref:uncharacterized protein LOC143850681 n=1 Tax=Tasmannia lanceolata TaxID=3420 RepID=UPI00406316D6
MLRGDKPRISKHPNLLLLESPVESKGIKGVIRISQHRINHLPPNVNIVERTTILRLADGKLGLIFDVASVNHSFVSSTFATLHSLPNSPLDYDLCVSTPVGREIVTNEISKMCSVKIGNRELLADFILLELSNFDVILGMDWLSTHYALVDCNKKIVNFEIPGEEKQDCEAFLASIVEVNDNEVKIENIPVVREFTDVFLEDLPGLPPNREVEFTVDLASGTTPISKAPYHMAPMEMEELKS